MSGKVFISYRREDEQGFARRLYERLSTSFGKDRLFFDIDSIPPGFDFVKYIENQIALSDIVVVVIGRNWLDARDAQGRRRLDNPQDFVRIEIESALKHGKHVVPLLVEHAPMPLAKELPRKLQPLARRNAFFAPYGGSMAEFDRLVPALEMAFSHIESERSAAEQARLERQRVEEEQAEALLRMERDAAAESERLAQAAIAMEASIASATPTRRTDDVKFQPPVAVAADELQAGRVLPDEIAASAVTRFDRDERQHDVPQEPDALPPAGSDHPEEPTSTVEAALGPFTLNPDSGRRHVDDVIVEKQTEIRLKPISGGPPTSINTVGGFDHGLGSLPIHVSVPSEIVTRTRRRPNPPDPPSADPEATAAQDGQAGGVQFVRATEPDPIKFDRSPIASAPSPQPQKRRWAVRAVIGGFALLAVGATALSFLGVGSDPLEEFFEFPIDKAYLTVTASNAMGMRLEQATPADLNRFPAIVGTDHTIIKSIELHSPAYIAGVSSGQLIWQVDGAYVYSPADIVGAIQRRVLGSSNTFEIKVRSPAGQYKTHTLQFR